MIQHTVIFNWKDGASSSAIDAVVSEVRDLSKIDGVTNLICGPNLGNGRTDYAFVLSMRLPSMEFLEKTYRPHPIHQRFSESLRKVIGTKVFIDFEL